ncbi:MAG: NMD3-related protein [Nanoarchaeota archaeon]|nr:NMD3-related protein [Nanoarchaeota archaeon]
MSKSIVFSKDNYYEAIIQLRPYNEEVFSFIEREILKAKKEVMVAKIDEIKVGLNIYLSSMKFARSLATKLKKTFHSGELKTTRKLHTRDKLTSKDVYRVTILFRYNPPKKSEPKEQ